MGTRTSIEWTRSTDGSPGSTWNPVTGCTEVSPGCDHCYAKTLAERFRGTPGHYFEAGFDVVLRPERLDQVLRWTRPRRVFVNSMSDLFHEAVPDEFIVEVFARMALATRHTFQLLTKRHGRMRALLGSESFRHAVTDQVDQLAAAEKSPVPPRVRDEVRSRSSKWLDPLPGGQWPLPHVWVGVSVETQQWADIRIPALRSTPAAVRFLSCEPLLGEVRLDLDGIDWVIVGGESGRGARPMNPAWARSLRDQCQAAEVAFLFKQWGEWAPDGLFAGWAGSLRPDEHAFAGAGEDARFTHTLMRRVGKKASGRSLDGRTWDEYPDDDPAERTARTERTHG